MFLSDLQQKIGEAQARYGNIPLSHVHVMHGENVLVNHGKAYPITIAEAEGVAGTLEERLVAAGPDGIVSLTGEELQQLLEYEAELKASYVGKIDKDVAGNAEQKAAVLQQEFERAQAKLGQVMTEAATKLPPEVDALKAHEDNQAELAQE